MHALLVSADRSPARLAALRALVGPDVELAAGAERLPSLDDVDALLLDGPPPALDAADLDAIRARVTTGASLVALDAGRVAPSGFWAGLLVSAGNHLPAGEYFLKPADTEGTVLVRLPGEFPVEDAITTLDVPPGAIVLAHVSIGFRDHPVVVESHVGDGRTVSLGLACRRPTAELATLVRRALQPRAERAARRDIGMAVLGYGPFGGMGYFHGTAARATPGLALVATCDASDERRKAAETDFPGIAAYANVDELAADADVELVVIATPPAFHAELALQMLRAGKHVACEKPLCLTAAQADALIATADDAGRVLTVHQNRRWDGDYLAVRRAVDAGMLGELFNVETFVGGFEHPCRAWHSDVSVSGGAVYDWGSHHIDWIVQLLGGPPAVVQTSGHKRVWHDVTNLDQLRVHLSWPDGREAEFFQSDVAAIRRPKFWVQGTAGTLAGHYRPVAFERIEPGRGYVREEAHHAEAPVELTLARYESGYGLTETQLPVAPEQRHAFHRNLADHLLLGEPLAVTPQSVRSVIAVLEAAQRSSDEGGAAITLDQGV